MFTEWTLWQSCPVTCGGAEHQRERICVGPFYGGADCDGDSIGSKKCNENPCPGRFQPLASDRYVYYQYSSVSLSNMFKSKL